MSAGLWLNSHCMAVQEGRLPVSIVAHIRNRRHQLENIMDNPNLEVDHELFSGESLGDIAVLTFKEKPLLHVTDLGIKKALFDYLDLIACCKKIRVLLIKQAPVKMEHAEYIKFYKSMIKSGFRHRPLERMYNAVGQLVSKLVGLDKMVVYADSGDVILLFMSIGMACDFRIVADNMVLRNPNIELGLLPKGGFVFLLSKMLGSAGASNLLFSEQVVDAARCCQLGIVNQVVPLCDLERCALETARSFAQIPTGYSTGIKRLLNYDSRELADFLEFENELLRRHILALPLREHTA
jgi:2-(1,2-epoxy-1,2-dihydrophenyl)acetyl-CoA isomerase